MTLALDAENHPHNNRQKLLKLLYLKLSRTFETVEFGRSKFTRQRLKMGGQKKKPVLSCIRLRPMKKFTFPSA
jgi:hypothetical protein